MLTLVAQGRSYRLIGREVGLSKNTIAEIVERTEELALPEHLGDIDHVPLRHAHFPVPRL